MAQEVNFLRFLFFCLLAVALGLNLAAATSSAGLQVALKNPGAWVITPLVDGSLYLCKNGDCQMVFKDDPVVKTPEIAYKEYSGGHLFIPDPFDGGLYSFGANEVVKLPNTVKELVEKAPFSVDELLIFGAKNSVVHAIDPHTGRKLHTYSDVANVMETTEELHLPEDAILLARTNYKITVVDTKSKKELWNVTFSEYSLENTVLDTQPPVATIEDEVRTLLLENEAWLSQFPSPPVAVYGSSATGPFSVHKHPNTNEVGESRILVRRQEGNIYVLPSNDPQTYLTIDAGDIGDDYFNTGFQDLPTCFDCGQYFSVLNQSSPPETKPVDNNTVIYGPISKPLKPIKPRPVAPREADLSEFLFLVVLSVGVGSFGTFAFLKYRPTKAPATFESSPVPEKPEVVPTPQPEENAGAKSPKKSHKKKKGAKGSGKKANEAEEDPEDGGEDTAESGSQPNGLNEDSTDKSPKTKAKGKAGNQLRVENELVPTEVSSETLENGWIRVGNLLVSDKKLGFGSHGTVVFMGRFENREVAVKRMLAEYYELAEREILLLQESDYHGNIIRYFCKERHSHFLYMALEYCEASLDDLYDDVPKEIEPDLKKSKKELAALRESLDEKRVLHDLVVGLRHLHELNIVHRDLKPQNVLISKQRKVLISDFGLCKKLEVGRASFNTSAPGTVGWTAPELLNRKNPANQEASRLTKSVDIFSLGCIFYFILTKGKHPFGPHLMRQANIIQGKSKLSGLGADMVAIDLISRMIAQKPEDRPTPDEILAHPFFWNDAKRLNFLQDASDRFEIEGKTSPPVLALEADHKRVIGPSWCQKIDPLFLASLGKFRKYQDESIRDLMRLIRNKKNHYQDLPEEVRTLLGPLPSGFLTYFTDRFPLLFLHVYRVVAATPQFRNDPLFGAYF